MKKSILWVLLCFFVFNSGLIFALDLKSVNKTKTQATNKNNQSMQDLNTKLKKVQNEQGPIVFKTGKADLDVAKCKKTLDTIALIIKGYPLFLVQVEGHTDNVGSAQGNLTLSQKRSQAVVNWLIKTGKVSSKQLKQKVLEIKTHRR